jgi:hypothetical protein
MTRPCPVCGESVEQRTGGRPAVYCGSSCRREVEHLRRDMPALEREVERAEEWAAGSERHKMPQAYARHVPEFADARTR